MTSSHSCNIVKFQFDFSTNTKSSLQDQQLIPYIAREILKFADNIKLSNFLFAHDSIKSNLPTFCDSITINIPILQKSRRKSGKYSYCAVRTKTSGSNSIKSKSANIWNYLKLFHSEQLIHQEKLLQIFINRLFCKGLCLTVPPLFIFYLFFFCV